MLRLDESDPIEHEVELASLLRATEPPPAHPGKRARSSTRSLRFRLFVDALSFTCKVLAEVARRTWRSLQHYFPHAIALADRWLVKTIRFVCHPYKKVNGLRLLFVLCVVLAIPYCMYLMHRVRLEQRNSHMYVTWPSRTLRS